MKRKLQSWRQIGSSDEWRMEACQKAGRGIFYSASFNRSTLCSIDDTHEARQQRDFKSGPNLSLSHFYRAYCILLLQKRGNLKKDIFFDLLWRWFIWLWTYMFEFKAFTRFLMCVIVIRDHFAKRLRKPGGTLRTLIQIRLPFVGTM